MATLAIIEGPLGRAHRRPSIFDRRVWVPMCEEEHAIDNRRLLEALAVNRASQEQWQNQDRKYENVLKNVCQSRSDAKYGFPSGPFSA